MTADDEGRPSPDDRSPEYLRLLAENERNTDAFDRSALSADRSVGLRPIFLCIGDEKQAANPSDGLVGVADCPPNRIMEAGDGTEGLRACG